MSSPFCNLKYATAVTRTRTFAESIRCVRIIGVVRSVDEISREYKRIVQITYLLHCGPTVTAVAAMFIEIVSFSCSVNTAATWRMRMKRIIINTVKISIC